MTYVYKPLPTGGYTTMPVHTPSEQAARLKEGWSLTPPVVEALAQAVVDAPTKDDAPVVDTPRRGRRRALVN